MMFVGKVGGAVVALAFLGSPASGSVINMGVDIDPGFFGAQVVTVVPFYNGDIPGVDVNTFFPSRTVTINTAAVFGTSPIASATLWVDATDVEGGIFGDNIRVFANGVDLGPLQSTPSPSLIPVVTGGYVPSVGELDNTVFTLTAALIAQLQTDTTFQVEFRRVGGLPFTNEANVQGFNIQAVVPEPGSMSLLGAGAVCLAGFTYRRLRKARAA